MGKIAILGILIATAAGWAACKRAEMAAHQPPASGRQAAVAEGSSVAVDHLAAVKPPGEAKLGDRTSCAAHSGPAFAVTESTPKAEYGGRTYYFCCSHCADRFLERPGDYVK